MRKALYAVLLSALFLLLLSALVVPSEAAEPLPAGSLPAHLHAAFCLPVPAVPPQGEQMPASGGLHLLPSMLPALFAGAILLFGVRDANGRVLSAVRYENSVYQLFRPEVAGG